VDPDGIENKTLSASVFSDKSQEPDSDELDEALGDVSLLLKNIEEHVLDEFGDLSHEWKFYSKKAGWSLALVNKGRRVLHLIPQSNQFTVVVTLGKRAVSLALDGELPGEIKSVIKSTREYAEGRPIRLGVATVSDAAIVNELVDIKMSS